MRPGEWLHYCSRTGHWGRLAWNCDGTLRRTGGRMVHWLVRRKISPALSCWHVTRVTGGRVWMVTTITPRGRRSRSTWGPGGGWTCCRSCTRATPGPGTGALRGASYTGWGSTTGTGWSGSRGGAAWGPGEASTSSHSTQRSGSLF